MWRILENLPEQSNLIYFQLMHLDFSCGKQNAGWSLSEQKLLLLELHKLGWKLSIRTDGNIQELTKMNGNKLEFAKCCWLITGNLNVVGEHILQHNCCSKQQDLLQIQQIQWVSTQHCAILTPMHWYFPESCTLQQDCWGHNNEFVQNYFQCWCYFSGK